MIIRNLLLWVVACLFVVAANCPAAEKGKEEVDVHKLVMAARDLSERDAAKLEKILENDPEDFVTRVTLIGYYFNKQYENEYAKNARVPHFLWVIKNRPGSGVAGFYMYMDPRSDGETYFEAKKLWLKQVVKHDGDAAVLKNAANFMQFNDHEDAEKILKKGQSLQPEDPHWPRELGLLYSRKMKKWTREGPTIDKGYARICLGYMESAVGMMDEKGRMRSLGDTAEAALGAEEMEKAKGYAKELLSLAERFQDGGQPIHDGHIILGKLALAEEDVKTAVKHLLEAGKTEGSPVLGSFGPDFTLAEELLDKGEKKAVIKYVELCSKFWDSGQECLKQWIILIKNKVRPGFEKHACK